MKVIVLLFFIFSFSFSFDNIYSTLKECSSVKSDIDRLNCYDSLALSKKPKTQLELDGEKLTKDCILCHGNNWEISTNGERLVSDMNEDQIYKSLSNYKTGKIKSFIMNYHMKKYSYEEIELMARYISFISRD